MRPPLRPPEINVTPLVDVVLVLLIIFMVVIPQLEAGAANTVVPQLKNLRRQRPDRPLQIKGDREARYHQVRSVFKDCQAVGFPGVSLEVGTPDEEPEGG
jgi:biopolymer transport protein TolR